MNLLITYHNAIRICLKNFKLLFSAGIILAVEISIYILTTENFE